MYRIILCITKEEKQSVDAVAGGVQPCAPGTRVLPLGPRRMETDQVYIPDWLRGNRYVLHQSIFNHLRMLAEIMAPASGHYWSYLTSQRTEQWTCSASLIRSFYVSDNEIDARTDEDWGSWPLGLMLGSHIGWQLLLCFSLVAEAHYLPVPLNNELKLPGCDRSHSGGPRPSPVRHTVTPTEDIWPKDYLNSQWTARKNDQPSGLLSNSFELNNSLCFVLNTSLNLESNRILLKKIRDYLHLSASISYHTAGSLTFEWKGSNGFVSNRSCIL